MGEFDRLTADQPQKAGRPKGGGNNRQDVRNSHATNKKNERLRAINRAPAVVQQLYDEGLIAVDLAA